MKLKETRATHIRLIYQMIFDIHQILVKNSIFYWAIGGTLLGAIRHKGIIPWDDDGDLGILQGEANRFWKLRSQFRKCGYSLIRDFCGFKIFYTKRKKMKGFPYSFPFVDIFVYKRIGNKIKSAYSDVRKEWPKDWFWPSEILHHKLSKFGSFKIVTPAHPERYFTTLYGKDWNKVAYRQYDHAKEEDVKSVKVKLTPEMRKPAKPFDKVILRKCVKNL